MFYTIHVCVFSGLHSSQRNFGDLSILALSITLLASWEAIAR